MTTSGVQTDMQYIAGEVVPTAKATCGCTGVHMACSKSAPLCSASQPCSLLPCPCLSLHPIIQPVVCLMWRSDVNSCDINPRNLIQEVCIQLGLMFSFYFPTECNNPLFGPNAASAIISQTLTTLLKRSNPTRADAPVAFLTEAEPTSTLLHPNPNLT